MYERMKQGYDAYHRGEALKSNPYSYVYEPGKHTDWVDGYYEASKEGPPNNVTNVYGSDEDSIFEGYGSISYT